MLIVEVSADPDTGEPPRVLLGRIRSGVSGVAHLA